MCIWNICVGGTGRTRCCWFHIVGLFIIFVSLPEERTNCALLYAAAETDAPVDVTMNKAVLRNVHSLISPTDSTIHGKPEIGSVSSVRRRHSERPTLRQQRRDNETRIQGPRVGSSGRRRRRHYVHRLTSHQLCRRHDLYVDVAQLGWEDTVIYPRQFNIRYCAGRCPSVVAAAGVDASNHAALKAIVRGRSSRRHSVPSACCVATSLRPINLLYRDKHRAHVDIWKLDDVIADTCGCR